MVDFPSKPLVVTPLLAGCMSKTKNDHGPEGLGHCSVSVLHVQEGVEAVGVWPLNHRIPPVCLMRLFSMFFDQFFWIQVHEKVLGAFAHPPRQSQSI